MPESSPRPEPSLASSAPIIVNGRGVLRIPVPARKSRFLRVMAQVTQDRSNKSENFNWYQPQTFYGTAQAIQNAAISQSKQLQYGINEVFFYDNDIAQSLSYAHCARLNANQFIYTIYRSIKDVLDALAVGQIFPTVEIVEVQPPYLPIITLDEVWFKLDGNCRVAVWCEWMPIDLVCESGANWQSPGADRGSKPPGLPNPTGQGNDGRPTTGDYQGQPAPTRGNGSGEAPTPLPGEAAPPGKEYWVGFTAPWYDGVVFDNDKQWGPFPAYPTVSLGANTNSSPDRYTQDLSINGANVARMESVGGPPTTRTVGGPPTVRVGLFNQ